MKNFQTPLFLIFLLLGALSYFYATADSPSFKLASFENLNKTEESKSSISFKIRGNGKGLVEIGVGSKIGAGACCKGVSKDATVSFQGKVGDVVWDSKTKRVLTELTSSSNGKIYDLRNYY